MIQSLLPGIICLLLSVGAAAKEEPWLRHEGAAPCMGTEFRCVIYGKNQEEMEKAADRVFTLARSLDLIFSDYHPHSELSRLCQAAPEPRKISAELYEVLDWSVRLAELTRGAFDPTVGHLSHLWRRAKRRGELPAEAETARALRLTDWRKLKLDREAQTAQLAPGMLLDLGAVAKGWTAEAMLKALQGAGYPRAMVACSGDLALGEPPPGETGWRVALRPFGAAPEKEKAMVLSRCCVSTSGAAFQFFAKAGARHSHVIDPRTGRSLTPDRAVTVIAPHGAVADALDTAYYVLGDPHALPQEAPLLQGVQLYIF